MSSAMSVGVVIVNYRSAELAVRALESLQAERARTDLELSVVVVDNASGDAPRLQDAIARRFSALAELVVSPVNGGFGAGNNRGVEALRSRGRAPRYLHFLNPDTEVRPGAVGRLVEFLEHHPRAGICGSSFELASGAPWPFAFRFPSPLGELEAASQLGVVTRMLGRYRVALTMGQHNERIDWLSGASMMLRREAFEQVGGFDEGFFLYFEEVDLCRRLSAAGWQCWYVPSSRVMHVCGHSTGVTTVDGAPRRFPAYWFESRRRYFLKHHGVGYAVLADAAHLAGAALSKLKGLLKGQPSVPHLGRDLVRSSSFWPSNRI